MRSQFKRALSMLLVLGMVLGMLPAMAAGAERTASDSWLTETGTGEDFPLVKDGTAATLWVDAAENTPVKRVVQDFKADIQRVTEAEAVVSSEGNVTGPVVVIGTLGKSTKVNELLTKEEKKALEGAWEAYLIKVVDKDTLVVAGSDDRGAVFGAY